MAVSSPTLDGTPTAKLTHRLVLLHVLGRFLILCYCSSSPVQSFEFKILSTTKTLDRPPHRHHDYTREMAHCPQLLTALPPPLQNFVLFTIKSFHGPFLFFKLKCDRSNQMDGGQLGWPPLDEDMRWLGSWIAAGPRACLICPFSSSSRNKQRLQTTTTILYDLLVLGKESSPARCPGTFRVQHTPPPPAL
jgi:hypothetical protein